MISSFIDWAKTKLPCRHQWYKFKVIPYHGDVEYLETSQISAFSSSHRMVRPTGPKYIVLSYCDKCDTVQIGLHTSNGLAPASIEYLEALLFENTGKTAHQHLNEARSDH